MCSTIYSAGSASGNRTRFFAFLTFSGLVLLFCVLRFAMAFSAPATQSRPARTEDIALLQSIPGDPVAAYVSFGTNGMDANTGQVITSLITTASMTGLFNANQLILADVVSALVTVGKFPYSVFLLDCGCRKLGEGSFTLDSLSMGMVVRAAPEEHGKFLVLLKQVLDHYFTADDAKLTWVGEGPTRHQKLESPKFPNWCCWEWGSIGQTFIFTVGPGAYDRVAKSVVAGKNTFAANDVIRLARQHDSDIDERFVMVYLDTAGLSRRLRPEMGASYDQVVASFSASDMDQFLYSAGFTRRAYISKTYTARDSGKVELAILTGDFPANDPRAKAVPSGATTYGVGYTDISKAVRYGVDTYLASRNPTYREKLVRNYDRLAEEAKLGDVHKILLSRFGKSAMVIVHDWPKHPFNLPIAKTILVQHDRSPGFKDTWNKVLGTWQGMLRAMSNNGKEDKHASAWETLFDLQIDRTPENIWFLHIGPLILVAAGMDDDFLVLSYSVPAVQANLQHLRSAFGAPTTTSQTSTRP